MAWTSPRTWVAGEKPTASTLNTHIRDNLKAIGDAWTAYAPTTGNITVGNGTVTAAYMQAGKWVQFRIKFTLGSTSAVTGSPTFTLPAAASAARTVTASTLMYDSSAAAATGYKAGSAFNNTTNALLLRDDASAVLSSTVPFTWAIGDELVITGSYEAS